MTVGAPWCVLLAAGSGRRFAGPKQFAPLDGARLVDRAVATAQSAGCQVVLVLPAEVDWDGAAVEKVVVGGATRADSVRAGLAGVPTSVPVVLIHDAAHPLATAELFAEVLAALADPTVDGVVPVVAATDTVLVVEAGRVTAATPASGLSYAQMPHGFRAATLRAAHLDAPQLSDDITLLHSRGDRVVAVAGDPRNTHITTVAELAVAEQLSGAR